MNVTYKLLKHQKEFIKSQAPFTVMSCSRAAGKTFAASLLAALKLIEGKHLILWGQDFKALTENLMSETTKRLDEMKIPYQYNRGAQKITYKNGIIYGMSYQSIEQCRGFTEIEISICDEIALAPKELLATLVFCMRGENIKPQLYAMSTPRGGSWWNLYLKEHSNEMNIIHATVFDNKFISEEQIELMKSTCASDSMLRQEMYGEVLDDVVDNCIVSINDFVSESNGSDKIFTCGIDFARTGDNTVITVRNSYELLDQVVMQGDTAAICSEFRRLDNIYHFANVYLDSTGGFDIGFYDEMKKTHGDVLHEINFGSKSPNPTDSNARTFMYFALADAIKNGFYIPFRFHNTVEQLKATSYVINNTGKRALVPKDVIKNIIGHSPDEADSLALTFMNTKFGNITDSKRIAELGSFLFR